MNRHILFKYRSTMPSQPTASLQRGNTPTHTNKRPEYDTKQSESDIGMLEL